MHDREISRSGRLTISGVSKFYGQARALNNIDLVVEAGEFVSLLGASGCGKTTLLRCIAGLVNSDGGTIDIDGHPLDGVAPWKRDVSVVFQSYALFPHMTVAENVAFGLKMRGVNRSEARTRVDESLARVHMEKFAERLPAQLSGGQQQRVALARAIVVRPRILLLDEPMAALDAKLRTSVQREIRQLQTTLGITTILVTHDQSEAMSMSDRIAVMNGGKIEQLADPQTLYARPTTPYVAEFVGEINRIHGAVELGGGRPTFVSKGSPVLAIAIGDDQAAASTGADATMMVRPEALELTPVGDDQSPAGNIATVVDRVQIGDRFVYYLRCGDTLLRSVSLVVNASSAGPINVGTVVKVDWHRDCTMMFNGHV